MDMVTWLVVDLTLPIWKRLEWTSIGMLTFSTEWRNTVPNHQAEDVCSWIHSILDSISIDHYPSSWVNKRFSISVLACNGVKQPSMSLRQWLGVAFFLWGIARGWNPLNRPSSQKHSKRPPSNNPQSPSERLKSTGDRKHISIQRLEVLTLKRAHISLEGHLSSGNNIPLSFQEMQVGFC